MCQFMSGIITQKETLFDLDNDSHEFLVEKYKLDDKTKEPDFVRVELVPKDGNVFNHKKSNWELKVDQDFQPEWFSKKFAEKEMRIALVQRIDQRFVIGRKIKEISIGVWWIGKGGSVNKVCFGGSVNNVWGSVKIYSPEAKYKKIEKDGIVILYYKYTPEIVVANKDIKLTLAEVVK
jgi:hypothetical protein